MPAYSRLWSEAGAAAEANFGSAATAAARRLRGRQSAGDIARAVADRAHGATPRPPGEHMLLLLLAAGGAAGTLARYTLSGWVLARTAAAFPWGTFTVNALGSLLIGFAIGYLETAAVSAELRAVLTVGLLGGFTTFSTYTYEAVALMRTGQWASAAAYALGSLAVGLLAVSAGLAAALLFVRARTG